MFQQIISDKLQNLSNGITNKLNQIKKLAINDMEDLDDRVEDIEQTRAPVSAARGSGRRRTSCGQLKRSETQNNFLTENFLRKNSAEQKSCTITRDDHYAMMDFSHNSKKQKTPK